MSIRAWLRASRLPSQSYIALPLILGQLLAWRATGQWSWEIFALVQLFGLFDQFYIVYANDFADAETDALNETSTVFSGGSRVLVEGSITPRALARAAVLMATLAVSTGAVMFVGWGRVYSAPLMVLGIVLLWAYSYRPIRLSYRGGGELLQMLGVGFVLPLIGYEAQAGELATFPWEVLAFLLPLNLATGLCTALPDEPSDRLSKKNTAAVLLGGTRARVAIIALNMLGLVLFGAIGFTHLEGVDWHAATLLVVPVVALAGQIFSAPRAKPGSHAILLFIFFGLLCNLSLVAGLIIDLAIA